jgi:hypothetical protein
MGDETAKDGPDCPDNRRIIVSYCAGFLDGEGCIYARTRGHSAQVTFSAVQIAIEPLILLRETFGGTVQANGRTKSGSIIYRWALYSRDDLEPAFAELLPHMRLKREQVRLALELLFCLPGSDNSLPVSSETTKCAHRLVERISELKRV